MASKLVYKSTTQAAWDALSDVDRIPPGAYRISQGSYIPPVWAYVPYWGGSAYYYETEEEMNEQVQIDSYLSGLHGYSAKALNISESSNRVDFPVMGVVREKVREMQLCNSEADKYLWQLT